MRAPTQETEEIETPEEWFDRKYPNCSCFRCDKKLNSQTVVECQHEDGCETWYCSDCHEEGTHDCPLIDEDEEEAPHKPKVIWTCHMCDMYDFEYNEFHLDEDGIAICEQCFRKHYPTAAALLDADEDK